MSYMLFKSSPYKEYKLRLTMQGVITLEDTFNKDIFTIINEIASGNSDFEMIFQVLKESLRYYGYVESDDDIYTITDSIVRDGYSMYEFPNLVANIFIHAGFFDNGSEENEDNENNNTYPGEGDNAQESTDKCFFYSLRDRAIECGMEESKFWNSTIGEVRRFIKAYNNNYIQSYKNSLTMAHLTADLVCYSVARLLDEKAEYPDVLDLNPELFKEELKQREVYKERQRQEKIKENLINLMKMCGPKETPEENNNKKGE